MKRLQTLLFSAVIASAASVNAAVTTVPDGFSPGDTYRLVFVTDGYTDATSSNIADYNAFATAQATNVAELAALNTTWSAIASTAAEHARNNVNALPPNDSELTAGIFRLDGNVVATNYTDLWDGSLSAGINITQTGAAPGITGLWTGSQKEGWKKNGQELGAANVLRGSAGNTAGGWMNTGGTTTNTSERPIYVMSGVLTVPAAAVPPSLRPGDTYRLIFATDGTINATNSDISVYNAFAADQATNIAALAALDTTWTAVVSTTNESARANTTTLSSDPDGSEGFWTLGGDQIAVNNAALWDAATTPLLAAPNISQTAATLTGPVWGGSNNSGYEGQAMGENPPGGLANRGSLGNTGGAWINSGTLANTQEHSIYVMSGLLTVPYPPVMVVDLNFDNGANIAPRAADTYQDDPGDYLYDWSSSNVLFNGSAALGQKIYGGYHGWVRTGTDPRPTSLNVFELSNGTTDRLKLALVDTAGNNGGYERSNMLLLWDSADFIAAGNTFDGTANSSFSLNVTQNTQGKGYRFVIRDGGTYYVANKIFGVGGAFSADINGATDDLQWGEFDPNDFDLQTLNLGTENLNQGVTFSSMTFSNVTGVGLYAQLDRWQGNWMQVEDFQVNLIAVPDQEGYAAWATDNGVGNMDEDYDEDGLNNFGEYAYKGDPKDPNDTGTIALGSSGGQFYFAHAMLIDTNEVEYLVEVNDSGDLVSGGWTNTGIAVTSGSLDASYDMVTNSIPMDNNQDFIRYSAKEK